MQNDLINTFCEINSGYRERVSQRTEKMVYFKNILCEINSHFVFCSIEFATRRTNLRKRLVENAGLALLKVEG